MKMEQSITPELRVAQAAAEAAAAEAAAQEANP